jgi:hypothetical protein
MLTINPDDHTLLRNYHQLGAEKRMIVVLPRPQWGEWQTRRRSARWTL